MSTAGISGMPKFEARFRQYHIEWMTTTSGQYNLALVSEFYETYQMDLKRPYPMGHLWKGGVPLMNLVIRGS